MAQLKTDISSGFFISGSDTGVGKTWLGVKLSRFFYRQLGANMAVYKPVESGCITKNGKLLPQDALAYRQAVDKSVALEKICPFQFAAPQAPPIAAQLTGKKLLLDAVVEKMNIAAKFNIVEGAGGICSPITSDGLNIDLATRLKLPIILVVKAELGCINQSIMAATAVASWQQQIAAVYLNGSQSAPRFYRRELEKYHSAPIFISVDELTQALLRQL